MRPATARCNWRPRQAAARIADQLLVEYPRIRPSSASLRASEPLNHRLTDRHPPASRPGRTGRASGWLRSAARPGRPRQAGQSRRGGRPPGTSWPKGLRFPFGDPLVLDPNIGFRNTPYVVNQLGSSYVDLPISLKPPYDRQRTGRARLCRSSRCLCAQRRWRDRAVRSMTGNRRGRARLHARQNDRDHRRRRG